MTYRTSRDLAANVPAALQAIGRTLELPRDGCVFRKGEIAQTVFLVLDGEVRLSRFGKDGGEIALHRAGNGDFFAEAALNAPRYQCNAMATRASTLLAFPAGQVRALIAKDPEFARQWIALLARQLHVCRARLERLALRSAADRIVHYLHTEGSGPRYEVTLPGNLKDLARELGLTHESLYRTLAGLEQKGLVRREGRHLSL
jgi:CRP-like cAMP-binding protein